MAKKTFNVAGIGVIDVYKRKGSTNIRLSVTQRGTVRVSIPAWVPYSAGLSFVHKRADWLKSQLAKTNTTSLNHGDRIGKSHRLSFVYMATSRVPTSRLKSNEIVITTSQPFSASIVQAAAKKASERALKKESERLLPQRLAKLALNHGLSYRNVSVKKLTSRWGSCSSKNDITLSYYLIQLDWKLIDYVLLHELVHTKHKNHGSDFWTYFEQIMPEAKTARKLLNKNQTNLIASKY